MAPHTKHYHIEDIAATGSTPTWCPAAGRSTFTAVLQEIEETGYEGWVTVELYPYIDDPDAAGKEARRFITQMMNEVREEGRVKNAN